MFRFKSIIVVLALVSCTEVQEECTDPNHKHSVGVMSKTDSILAFADNKINKIRQHQVEQEGYIDSLQFEINTEQHLIDDIQIQLIEKISVEEDLKLTEHDLEAALIECRRKEMALTELNEKFILKADEFMDKVELYADREIKLITIYNHKIDSLNQVIELLKIPVAKSSNKKKRKKKSKPF